MAFPLQIYRHRKGLPVIPLDNLIQPIWDISPYPIAITSFDGDPKLRNILYVNSAFSSTTGYSNAEAIGQPATLLYGPKTSQAGIQEYEASIALGKPCRATLTLYRKDGSAYVAFSTIAPLVEPDGSAHFLILIETEHLSPEPVSMPNAEFDKDSVVPLFLPMPLEEFPAGHLPRHLVSHPELDTVQALWTRKRGDRLLPLRTDFDLATMSRWASHLSIATVMPKGQFQFRLFGTELARVYGQDLTGRFLDDLTPKDLWSVIVMHYQEVVSTLRPLFAPISVANGRWYTEVSRLLLPLASESDINTAAAIMGIDYKRAAF
jgi:PAS domain S-box-containing protein